MCISGLYDFKNFLNEPKMFFFTPIIFFKCVHYKDTYYIPKNVCFLLSEVILFVLNALIHITYLTSGGKK